MSSMIPLDRPCEGWIASCCQRDRPPFTMEVLEEIGMARGLNC